MKPNWMPGVAALIGLALAGPTSAEPRDIYERGPYRYEAYANRIGFDNGYEDGLRRGRHDGDRGDRFDLARDSRYRDGDHGYRRSYGPRSDYVRSYRSGYAQGYRDGFAPFRYGRRGYGARDGYYGRDGDGRDGYYGRDGYNYRDRQY